ncbi:MAG: hypothetical protein KY459_11935 [Acidobacteria bacterium]|nr:hypothetical protein [Acidobacteriota bacterium]
MEAGLSASQVKQDIIHSLEEDFGLRLSADAKNEIERLDIDPVPRQRRREALQNIRSFAEAISNEAQQDLRSEHVTEENVKAALKLCPLYPICR